MFIQTIWGKKGPQKRLFLLCAIVLIAAIGCNSEQPTDSNQPTDSQQGGTDQDSGNSDNQNTGNNAQTQPPQPVSVQFSSSADGSAATINGERSDSGPNRYRFNGKAGETLSITISSEPNVGFGLYFNGVQIEPSVADGNLREWQLTQDGEYELQAFNGGTGSPFTLTTTLKNPAAGKAPSTTQNQNDGRIEFDAGTTGKTITGEIGAGQTNSYVLQVGDGQFMTVILNGPDTVGIGAHDKDGLLLESQTSVTSWTSPELNAGDITLTVSSQNSGSYQLTVNVVDEYTLVDKGRIQFDAGATSKTVSGSFTGTSLDTYVVGAAEGQIMTVELNGPQSSMFSIRNDAIDKIIFHPTGPVSTITTEPLPVTGDYEIGLGPSFPGDYELTVTIVNQGLGGSPSLPDGPTINATLNPLGDVFLIFKGDTNDGNFVQIQDVDIYDLNGNLLQTLPFRSESTVPTQPPALFIEDVNFDGFTDLGIPTFTTAGSNLPLSYFLWDPTVNQFVRNENFDVLMGPTILDGKRILTRGRVGVGDVYYSLYAIGKSGPIEIARQSCEITQNDEGETIILNKGFTIDSLGVETQTFEQINAADSEVGCLDYQVFP